MKYAVFLFVVAGLFLFIRTAPPSIYLGDSGEIAAAAFTMGIPHPPGYPLAMLAGKLSMLFFPGDMAFRMNILASLLAVICFVFIYLAGVEILGIVFKDDKDKRILKFSSLFVAVTVMFSSMFWFEGIHAKGSVYMLAMALMAITLYFAMRHISTRADKYLYAAFFTAGFLMPAHNSSTLFMVSIFAMLIYFNRKRLSLKLAVMMFSFFFLSFLISYLYLFIRAGSGTPVNFGYIKDFWDVITHISRKAYVKQYTAAFDMGTYFTKMFYCAAQFVEKYNVLALFLAAGLFALYSYSRKIALAAGVFIAANTALLIYVVNTSAGFPINSMSAISLYASKNFYFMNDLVPVIVSAAGVHLLLRLLTQRYGINSVFAGSMLMLAPALMIIVNFSEYNYSRSFLAYDHGVNINKSLKTGDTVWAKGDCPLFNIVYLQSVKGHFAGIKTFDRDANMLDESVFEGVKAKPDSFIKEKELKTYNLSPGNVYYTSIADFPEQKLFTLPYGIIFRMSSGGTAGLESQAVSKLYSFRDYFNNSNNDLYYRSVAAKYFVMRGRYAGLAGNRELADKWLKLAFSTASTDPDTLNALATVYYFSFGDVNTAIDYERRIYELDPSDNTAIRLLIGLFKQVNPLRSIECLNVLYNRSTDETEKANIKKDMDAINSAAGR